MIEKPDPLEIPDFLIIPQEVRRAAWKGRRLTTTKAEKAAASWEPKTMEPVAYRIRREQEKLAERKKQERLAALKALRESSR